MTEFSGENHCSRNDGTRQRATARLVNSGDPRDSDGTESFLVTKSTAPVHRQKLSADCADFHRNFLGSRLLSRNLYKSANGAAGISDIEGKAATGSGEQVGKRASFKSVDPENQCYSRTAVASLPLRVRR